MQIVVDIAPLAENGAINLIWRDNFVIEVTVVDGKQVVLKANSAGFVTLASHMLALSQSSVSPGTHVHLDEFNALEEGSVELILERQD